MTLTKISPSGWAYYADEIAAGREDYYVDSASPSLWAGSGAKALGIHGEVITSEGLAALFGRGMNPLTDQPLGRSWNENDDSRVAGYARSRSHRQRASRCSGQQQKTQSRTRCSLRIGSPSMNRCAS